MGATIDNAFVNQYRDNVIYLAQQGDNRVRQHVMEVSSTAEYYYWDRIGEVDTAGDTPGTGYTAVYGVYEKSGQRRDTEYHDADWSRRGSKARTFNITLSFEQEDQVQMLIDPKSTKVTAMGMAMKRAYDRLIIDSATSDTYTVDGDNTPIVFPTGQIVGDGTVAISFDFITEIQEKFMENEIMMDYAKVALVGPTQVRKLLQLTEQTSADFVHREALQKLTMYGVVPNWMGFTWIVSNYLTVPSVGELYCLFFTKMALGLQVNENMIVRIGENPDKSYMWQCFNQFTASCTRVEDEHIIVGHVADTL